MRWRTTGRTAASLVIILFCVTAAHAQAIRWRPELLGAGDFVTLEQSQGAHIHHVYRGRKGDIFVVETFFGNSAKGAPMLIHHLDRNGNKVRQFRSDGSFTAYDPHDCARTTGRCEYVQIERNGSRVKRRRNTQQTPQGFSYKIYGPSLTLIEEGALVLGDVGFVINGWIKEWGGSEDQLGKTNRITLIAQSD